MADITITAVKKSYGRAEVLHGLDINIADGEFIVIVGPSGCGKSTLLRIIAGLEKVTDGEVAIGGRRVNDLEPMDRNIAMVFQNYALYPHMSVFQNLAYGLKIAKTPGAEIQQRVAQAAQLLQLTALLKRKPKDLSGGQRQRVAMGRAIVREPAVFLFDEPLSNLDARLRSQMRLEIKSLQKKLGVTSVYVTHDQVEAMTLADRIVVMNEGVIEQIGRPDEIYNRRKKSRSPTPLRRGCKARWCSTSRSARTPSCMSDSLPATPSPPCKPSPPPPPAPPSAWTFPPPTRTCSTKTENGLKRSRARPTRHARSLLSGRPLGSRAFTVAVCPGFSI